jgi:AcrR family transcriptional regulator
MNDTDWTRDRLIAAGRKLFAEKGFGGATVRELTALAHANIGAVTYHFGSKQALYLAILDTVLSDLGDRVEQAGASAGSAASRLRAIIHTLFAFFGDAPDVPALVLRELAAGAGPPEPLLRLFRRNVAVVERVVRDGQRRGELREVDPLLVAFSLFSQPIWFLVVGRHLARMGGVVPNGAQLDQRIEQHIGDVICRALAAEDATS